MNIETISRSIQNNDEIEKIGLIAGSGQFPVIFSDNLSSKNFLIYTVAYLGEADPVLMENSTCLEWMHPGEVNRLIKFFKKNKVRRIVMLGAIKKTKLFKDIRPDIKAISILAQLRTTHDDAVMRAFAEVLEKNGIIIEPSVLFTPELVAIEGIWTRRKPSRSELRDIKLGLHIARGIGSMDIGQSVIVGQGSVLAIEAVEGTDAAIKRGGSLCSKRAVLVKICKPNQDKRFDMPVVGLRTIESMFQYNVGTLVVKAGETVIFDRAKMIKRANDCKIAIVCL